MSEMISILTPGVEGNMGDITVVEVSSGATTVVRFMRGHFNEVEVTSVVEGNRRDISMVGAIVGDIREDIKVVEDRGRNIFFTLVWLNRIILLVCYPILLLPPTRDHLMLFGISNLCPSSVIQQGSSVEIVENTNQGNFSLCMLQIRINSELELLVIHSVLGSVPYNLDVIDSHG